MPIEKSEYLQLSATTGSIVFPSGSLFYLLSDLQPQEQQIIYDLILTARKLKG